MKKFGVSYNVFDDSIELLESSIKSIRDNVDFISVVLQDISNFNRPATEPIQDILSDLQNRKLVDKTLKFNPLQGSPHVNEINKRNIGKYLSEGVKCDYHMAMDSDEYYIDSEFKNMKQYYTDNDLDSGFAQMITYYHSFEYVIDPPEEYYVSLFYKVNSKNNYSFGLQLPVVVDPTRQMIHGNYKIFNRDEIQMHHASYVRKNIRKKFENSSANVNFSNEVESLIKAHDDFENTDKTKGYFAGKPSTWYNLKKVEPLFNL